MKRQTDWDNSPDADVVPPAPLVDQALNLLSRELLRSIGGHTDLDLKGVRRRQRAQRQELPVEAGPPVPEVAVQAAQLDITGQHPDCLVRLPQKADANELSDVTRRPVAAHHKGHGDVLASGRFVDGDMDEFAVLLQSHKPRPVLHDHPQFPEPLAQYLLQTPLRDQHGAGVGGGAARFLGIGIHLARSQDSPAPVPAYRRTGASGRHDPSDHTEVIEYFEAAGL